MVQAKGKIRYGVVGLGVMGIRHAQWIAEDKHRDFTLGGVSTRRPELARRVGKQLSVPHFTDAKEMFDSGLVDAVVVATPHYWHPHVVIQAARAGLHVVCEKPLAPTIGPAMAMLAECRKRKVSLGVMQQYRTRSVMAKAKQVIDSGQLGELYRVTMTCTNWYRTQAYYDSGSWRGTWDGEGGGILLNQAQHHLDLFIWLGGMPKSVTAFLDTRLHKIEVENTANVICDYGRGKTGYIYTTTAQWPGGEKFEFYGDKGAMIIEDGELKVGKLARPISKHLFEYKENRADEIIPPACKWRDIKVPADPRFQHMNVFRNFAAHLKRGKKLTTTGDQALNELMLSNAMYLSGFGGKTVTLPIDPDAIERLLARLDRQLATGRGKGQREKAKKALKKLLAEGPSKK